MTQRKSLHELTLLDRFLFAETVEVPENMQAMLEIILGRDGLELKGLPQAEKEQRTSSRLRFVKLDVWTQDTEGMTYDTEVQRKNTGNLPRRSRFYQALMDSKLMEPGMDDFGSLGSVMIILISPFDLFGMGRYRYTFSMSCEEVDGLKLDDGAVRMFLNTHGKDDENITPELKELLEFMEYTNDDSRIFKSERVKKIRSSVRAIQDNSEVSIRYMNAWEEVLEERREARAEGKAEGRAEGKAEGKAEERSVMNSLFKVLMKDGRMDDLRRSLDDEEYQESLLAEYGLGVDV